jgi:transcriptional regulator with XRE-family HTH domain
MYVQLEGGDTNISLSTLDRIAEALGVDFVAIVSDPMASRRRIDALMWRGGHADSEATLLGTAPASDQVQLWSWSLGPGDRYVAEPDPAGWHEMILVIEGRLLIELDEGNITIGPGEYAIYGSAQNFAYQNVCDATTRFIRNVVS